MKRRSTRPRRSARPIPFRPGRPRAASSRPGAAGRGSAGPNGRRWRKCPHGWSSPPRVQSHQLPLGTCPHPPRDRTRAAWSRLAGRGSRCHPWPAQWAHRFPVQAA
ncbi:MAG: hypothetical protein FJ038_09060 [Chloroflexi bacterium]|nr:hypothetical protein [Chloroflexota bacterium]